MKLPSTLICAALAAVLGYMVEPLLRPQQQQPASAPAESSAASPAVSQATPAAQVVEESPTVPTPPGNESPAPADVAAADVPPAEPSSGNLMVKLTENISHTDSATGLSKDFVRGSMMILVSRDGDRVTVRPPGTQLLIEIPASKTDLAPLQDVGDGAAPVAPPGESQETPPAIPAATPDAPPVDAEPAPAPAVTEEPAPAPTEEPATVEPTAEPSPVPALAPSPPAAAPSIVGIMQQSVRSGEIKEFTLDQVSEWQAGGDETVDEVVYQTGSISYKAKTVFGMKTIQAKAYIKDGKVVRWVWPKSGLEIR